MGTGKNLPYYPKDIDLTAIDISPKMMNRAKVRARKAGIKVDLRIMDAQNLEFPDGTFDMVVTTFVLCSVPDPIKAISEMRRVLKPDGQLLALEHLLSENPMIAIWERIHNPITVRLIGVNVNRDTRSNLERAGFRMVKDERLALKDVFRRFTCHR